MSKVQNLTAILKDAKERNYAAGSFSARYTKLIRPIIEAAVNTNSPAIVQLSEKEVIRHEVGVKEFADEFYRVVEELDPQVPLVVPRGRMGAGAITLAKRTAQGAFLYP